MIKKTILIILFIVIAIPYFVFADDSDDDEMEGDEKLACEAILCLSSGERPDECSPSLERYFSIKKKKWKDTVKSRKKFLKKCPEAGSNNDPKMETLITAIANGGGMCDAATLNKRGEWATISEIKIIDPQVNAADLPCQNQSLKTANINQRCELISDGTDALLKHMCKNTTKDIEACKSLGKLTIRVDTSYWRINQTPPGYCSALLDHGYTGYGTRFVEGQNPWESKWVD